MKMLEGYVLASFGGGWLIGREQARTKVDGVEYLLLSPTYAAMADFEDDGRGNFGVLRRALPLLGSGSVKEVMVPLAQAVVLSCSNMGDKERQAWANAITQAEAYAKAIRQAESGLVLAPADVKLPPPPGK